MVNKLMCFCRTLNCLARDKVSDNPREAMRCVANEIFNLRNNYLSYAW